MQEGQELTIFFLSASELQSWLLYYSIPCLVGYLPDKYLRHYAHLAEGIYILLGDEISQSSLSRAGDLLNTFYKDFQELYGMVTTVKKLFTTYLKKTMNTPVIFYWQQQTQCFLSIHNLDINQ